MPEIDISRSVLIGDSATDVLAASALGCPSFLVGEEADVATILAEHPSVTVRGWGPSLLDVVASLLGRTATGGSPTL